MKRFLFLIALFTLMGGANSVKAEDVHANLALGSKQGAATWTQVDETSTYTFTWTDTGDDRNDYISLFAAFGGVADGELDWSDGLNFLFTCSGPSASETNALNVIIIANGGEFSRAMYSDGDKTLTLTATSGDGFKNGGTYITAEDLKHVTDIRIQATNKSDQVLTAGSVNVTNFYVQQCPRTVLNFNASGIATIPLSKIDVSGDLTYNSSTGAVTSSGTGEVMIEFDKAYDFVNVKNWSVSGAGTDIFGHWKLKGALNGDKSELDMYSGWFYRDVDALKAGRDLSAITGVRLYVSKEGTYTFSELKFTANSMKVADGHDVAIETLPHYTVNADGTVSSAAAIGTDYGKASEQPLGDGSSKMDEYIDIADYDELRIYTSENARVFFINAVTIESGTSGTDGATAKLDNSESGQVSFTYNSLEGYYSASVSAIKEKYNGHAKIIGVKGASWGAKLTVSKIQVYKENPTYDFILSGQYSSDTDISAVTSSTSATAIDCSSLSGNDATITTGNPNCLFVAKNGVLANTKNVIVPGTPNTCAKLELTDGYPFKAPADFTATTATYTRNLGSAGAGTLCLPFAAAIPDGVTAYTLEYSSGDKAAATPVNTTILANTPVLLNGSGEKTFSGSGAVSASATNVVGSLTGVFASESVPTNSYVLQKQGDNVGFYKVNTDITIPPFRAYLTADADARGFIGIDEMSPTGVNEVKVNKAGMKTGKIYNLNGQIVSKPTKGLYIVDGKVVSF